MQKPMRVVIFDLGSTLIYENGPWDELFIQADSALWSVLRQAGVTLQPRELFGDAQTLFSLYYDQHRNDLEEPTTAAVLNSLLKSQGFRLPKETLREAMRAMFSVTQTNWLPEEDAVPTLQRLRRGGLRLGLISNASDDDNTQALIDKACLRPYLEYVISSARFGRRKPDPGIFRAALAHFGEPPHATVMVGDNYEADIAGAHAAGMQGIWITRRAAAPLPEPSEVTAEAVVTTLAEIPPALGLG
jgi:HAD superfamily hydrolase (TIGR01509 family)